MLSICQSFKFILLDGDIVLDEYGLLMLLLWAKTFHVQLIHPDGLLLPLYMKLLMFNLLIPHLLIHYSFIDVPVILEEASSGLEIVLSSIDPTCTYIRVYCFH